MTDREETFAKVAELIEPFNKKDIELTEGTTFAGDLEWDSLTVMDFVAAIEDEFDILITMNMQAEIETVGQLVDAVEELRNDGMSKRVPSRRAAAPAGLDLFAKFDPLIAERQSLLDTGVRDPFGVVMEKVLSPPWR